MADKALKDKLAEKANGGATQAVAPRYQNVKALLSEENIKRRFSELLGSKAPGFISSIVNVVNGNPELQRAEPMTVVSAAAIAAALDLPIDPNLGFAYIVPYAGRAQFQLGYKGYVQLAMRTGAYKTINACEVYEGEIKSHNRFTGEIEFGERASDKVVGYIAYFKLLNGFEKYLYMSVEDLEKHARMYSKSYNSPNSRWKVDFHAMALKTVLKRLLSKYGILSIEMQTSLRADQAVVKETEEGAPEYEYPDGVVEAEAVEVVADNGQAAMPIG